MTTSIRWRDALIPSIALIAMALSQGADADESSGQALTVAGGPRGVFDPSVTEDPATGRLWMSYSSFEASTHSRSGIELRIAYSEDGERWHDAGTVQRHSEVLVGPLETTEADEPAIDEGTRGTWQNETSTLVYDDNAPREQRWKLFWHQSLWANDAPRYASYGWIALKVADTPENLAQAPPVKLFTGYMARNAADSEGMPVFSPLPRPPAIQLDKRDPQLGACVFGQPAALSARGALYLALDCAWLGTRPSLHTVLLRCAYPGCDVTNAASWTVVGRLTEPPDAPRIDERYKGFGGTSLAEKDGRYYLLATPISAKGDRYDGCYVFRFDDLAQGKLERQRRGALVVARTVRGVPDTHHGACAAHSRLKEGILMSQILSTASPRVMQIRSTGVELP